MLKSTYPTHGRAGTRWWSLPLVLAVTLLALLWAAGSAQAHGEQFARAEKIWPLLNEQQPEELEGVSVRLENTQVGQWVIAENNTGEPLEIYDTRGEPFLRLGPGGVEYNRFAEEYYLTKPQSESPPKEARGDPQAEPEWVRLADKPSVTWRDRRIVTEGMDVATQVPMEARRAREDVDVGEWNIPVRLGEAETEVRGTYRYDAPPKGDYAARLTSDPGSPDITVQLLHGVSGGADALSLQNRSGEPVTIFDASGEPAVRIGPEETQVNVNSPVGRSTVDLRRGIRGAGEAPETAQPQWETVSGGSGFIWLDPRLRPPDGQPQPDDPETVQEVGRWDVPMEVAGEEEVLTGVVEWQPSDWQPPEQATTDQTPGIGFREVATVVALTVAPAVAILAVLMGPGLYKRFRYRQ